MPTTPPTHHQQGNVAKSLKRPQLFRDALAKFLTSNVDAGRYLATPNVFGLVSAEAALLRAPAEDEVRRQSLKIQRVFDVLAKRESFLKSKRILA